MTIGLVGKKAGMTRVFTEDGASVPVTVIEVEPNRITRVKSRATATQRVRPQPAPARPSTCRRPRLGSSPRQVSRPVVR